MGAVKEFLTNIWRAIAEQGFSEQEVLAALVLLAAIRILFGFVSLFRKRRRVDNSVLSSRVDHVSIQIADIQSSLSRHLAELPSGLTSPGASSSSNLATGDEKKKLDEVVIPKKVSSSSLSAELEGGAPVGVFAGLKKTRDAFRNRLSQVFGSGRGVTKETLDELEELLISSDLGVRATARLLEGLSLEAKARGRLDGDEAKEILKAKVRGLLGSDQDVEISIPRFEKKPVVILVVGVNGVGKTTTIGKLTRKFVDQGFKVTLAACDTFRAAAVEQIRVWGERAGVEVVSGAEGVKPTTVLFQAMEKVNARGDDILIVDTAGRLHTRVNLMNELGSIVSMIERLCPGAPHEALLVVDATTGQNALEQAREFGKKVNLTGLIVTKLDGTPKGGIVVAIREELGIPIRYIGVGEKTEDLRPFSVEEFVDALFDDAPQAYRGDGKRNLDLELH